MMKKVVFFIALVIVFASCSNQKKDQATAQPVEQAVVYTVDELYENAGDLVDKEVIVKGTVMHVCKEGGVRCFIMGSNEDVLIRVEAGEGIGAFTQEQMGSELEIVGVFNDVSNEAEAHNPGMEHGEAVEGEDAAAENAHETIADAQEAQEVVYFIQGLKAKELKPAPEVKADDDGGHDDDND